MLTSPVFPLSNPPLWQPGPGSSPLPCPAPLPPQSTQPLPLFSTATAQLALLCHLTSRVTPIPSIVCAQFPSPRGGVGVNVPVPCLPISVSAAISFPFKNFAEPRAYPFSLQTFSKKHQGVGMRRFSTLRSPSLAFGGFGSRFSGVRLSFLLNLETSILKHLPFTTHCSLFTAHSPLTLPVPATYNPAVSMNAGLSHFDRRRMQ